MARRYEVGDPGPRAGRFLVPWCMHGIDYLAAVSAMQQCTLARAQFSSVPVTVSPYQRHRIGRKRSELLNLLNLSSQWKPPHAS